MDKFTFLFPMFTPDSEIARVLNKFVEVFGEVEYDYEIGKGYVLVTTSEPLYAYLVGWRYQYKKERD